MVLILRQYVSNLERGKNDPTVGIVVRVANALGCPWQDLLEDER
jgi:transcriptional regulator with XRE-family HTH domain